MKAQIDRGGIHRRMETEVGIFQDSNKKRRNGGFCLQRNHLQKRKQWGPCVFGGPKWLVWFDDQVGTEKSEDRMEPQGRGPGSHVWYSRIYVQTRGISFMEEAFQVAQW